MLIQSQAIVERDEADLRNRQQEKAGIRRRGPPSSAEGQRYHSRGRSEQRKAILRLGRRENPQAFHTMGTAASRSPRWPRSMYCKPREFSQKSTERTWVSAIQAPYSRKHAVRSRFPESAT